MHCSVRTLLSRKAKTQNDLRDGDLEFVAGGTTLTSEPRRASELTMMNASAALSQELEAPGRADIAQLQSQTARIRAGHVSEADVIVNDLAPEPDAMSP